MIPRILVSFLIICIEATPTIISSTEITIVVEFGSLRYSELTGLLKFLLKELVQISITCFISSGSKVLIFVKKAKIRI